MIRGLRWWIHEVPPQVHLMIALLLTIWLRLHFRRKHRLAKRRTL